MRSENLILAVAMETNDATREIARLGRALSIDAHNTLTRSLRLGDQARIFTPLANSLGTTTREVDSTVRRLTEQAEHVITCVSRYARTTRLKQLADLALTHATSTRLPNSFGTLQARELAQLGQLSDDVKRSAEELIDELRSAEHGARLGVIESSKLEGALGDASREMIVRISAMARLAADCLMRSRTMRRHIATLVNQTEAR